MNRSEMAEWLCDERLTLSTMLEFDEFDTDEQKQRGGKFIEAIDLLQGFLCGHDPAERLPDGGKVVLIHYEYPHSDLLETATYDPVLERWNVILFTGTAVAETDEIDRWYPAPGGA